VCAAAAKGHKIKEIKNKRSRRWPERKENGWGKDKRRRRAKGRGPLVEVCKTPLFVQRKSPQLLLSFLLLLLFLLHSPSFFTACYRSTQKQQIKGREKENKWQGVQLQCTTAQ